MITDVTVVSEGASSLFRVSNGLGGAGSVAGGGDVVGADDVGAIENRRAGGDQRGVQAVGRIGTIEGADGAVTGGGRTAKRAIFAIVVAMLAA